jgi:prophage regulatory protein
MSTKHEDRFVLLDDAGLRQLGIAFSRQHRHRLIRQGRFPRPVKVGENKNAWLASEIHDWIAARIAERDAERAA